LDELLWTSPQVTNVDTWETYCGTLIPSKSLGYLRLVYAPDAGASGYLLIDNFRPKASCN